MTRTGGNQPAFDSPAVTQAFLERQPLARHGEPDDQANAVRYFAGPESVGDRTGATVDGGCTLRSFIDNGALFKDPGDPANFT